MVPCEMCGGEGGGEGLVMVSGGGEEGEGSTVVPCGVGGGEYVTVVALLCCPS